jgi:outer membrane receptor protein involved in Fe transport
MAIEQMKIPAVIPVQVLFLSGLSLALLSPASPALSQKTGTIRGRVESSVTNEALEGVRVSVQGKDLSTLTGEDGEFRLQEVTAGTAYLTLELPPDYVTTIEQVIVRAGGTVRARFQMEPMAVILEGFIIRGQPAASDAQVRVFAPGEATDLTGGGTAVDLLSASFSGIQVTRGTGQAGAGSRILIRGTNSLTMAGDPLVFIDGVRVNDVVATGGSEASNVLGFLDLIPANTVTRIEVLKGPAATRYGVASSNGVIFIFTR